MKTNYGITPEFEKISREMGNGYTPPEPEIEFLYRIIVDVDVPVEVGAVDSGSLKIIPITGGRFEGPKLNGQVLPLGADWNTSPCGNSTAKHIDTRYILKTDDGSIISLFTKGYVKQSEEVMKMRTARRSVDPKDYYFKQHLFFETSAEKYLWLNNTVAFGCVISKITPGVIYDAWMVK